MDRQRKLARPLALGLLAAVTLLGWEALSDKEPGGARAQEGDRWPEMPRYAAMEVPADNPMTPAKVELGKQLFYDRRLSADETRGCFLCHLGRRGLSNGRGDAIGAYKVRIPRSPPNLWNAGYYGAFFWDGRAASLEETVQILWGGPALGATGQAGRPGRAEVCARLDKITAYRRQFQEVFGSGCTPDNAAKAIAAFLRTIVANDSAWARFRAGEESALSEQARRGYEIFKGKARCTNCHDGVLLTDQQFHNIGIGWNPKKKEFADPGRYAVTGNERDQGAFKTPTLLDIADSDPYFHDGSVRQLEDAMDLMLRGGIDNPYLDQANLRPPVELTDDERDDLLQFLRELTVDHTIERPQLPK